MFQFTFCWCIYFPVSLQQPGVKLPSTQAIHIYFPNQQGKMCSGCEISGMVSAGWHGCEGCRGACSLAMPQPVWSALGWRLSPPQIMQLCSCLAGLRLHRGKIIITVCLEHTRNLWQRNRILPEITMAETSFFPSVLIFRLLHAPFLSLPSLKLGKSGAASVVSPLPPSFSFYSCLIAIFCYAGHWTP